MTATEDLLASLHGALAEDMVARIKSGEATAAEWKEIRTFLKENGIEAVPAKGSPIGDLVDAFPDLDDEKVVTFLT